MIKPSFAESLEIFGLESLGGQTEESLKKIYHNLAVKYHPDKEGGSVRQFIRLREAYSLLKMRVIDPAWQNYRPGEEEQNGNYQQEQTRQSHVDWQAEAERLRRELEIYKDAYQKHSEQIFRYENRFNLQINLVNETKQKINQIIQNYTSQVDALQSWLDENLAKANEKYERKWWQHVIRIKKLTRAEYVQLHNKYVNEFNEKMNRLEKELTEGLLRAYKSSMEETLNLFEL